jgi:hypothetical protein
MFSFMELHSACGAQYVMPLKPNGNRLILKAAQAALRAAKMETAGNAPNPIAALP